MNLGRIKDFNRYVYIASRRILPPREWNPSTTLLSGQFVRPLKQSPPNIQHITKANFPRGQNPPTCNTNISIKIFDST